MYQANIWPVLSWQSPDNPPWWCPAQQPSVPCAASHNIVNMEARTWALALCSAGTCTWSLATHHALHITYHEYCLCMMYSHCSCVPLKFKNVYFEAVFAGYIISSWMKAIWSQGNCGHSWCWDKLCWPLVWWGNWGTVSRFTNDIIYNRCTCSSSATLIG